MISYKEMKGVLCGQRKIQADPAKGLPRGENDFRKAVDGGNQLENR